MNTTYHIYNLKLMLYNPFPHETREAAEAQLATMSHPEWFGVYERWERIARKAEDTSDEQATWAAEERAENLREDERRAQEWGDNGH